MTIVEYNMAGISFLFAIAGLGLIVMGKTKSTSTLGMMSLGVSVVIMAGLIQ